MPRIALAPWQYVALHQPYRHFAMICGVACVRGSTRVDTEHGPIEIRKLTEGTRVRSVLDGGKIGWARCRKPFVKGRSGLLRISHERGVAVVHPEHLLALVSGEWVYAKNLRAGDALLSCVSTPLESSLDVAPQGSDEGARHYWERDGDSTLGCLESDRLHGRPLPAEGVSDRESTLRRTDEQQSASLRPSRLGSNPASNTRHLRSSILPSSSDFGVRSGSSDGVLGDPQPSGPAERTSRGTQSASLFQRKTDCHPLDVGSVLDRTSYAPSRILSVEKLEEPEDYYDVEIPSTGNYTAEGLVHHNTGKTFTGSHFAITQIKDRPEQTGFIGANTYDQMTQATLREFFYWLEVYGFDYVVDRRPPTAWGRPKGGYLKKYDNVISVRYGRDIVTIFTRILAKGNPLRGTEFSWYWIDESRDTPLNTHDIIMSRLRESEEIKGLVTTTPNAEDWTLQRFVRGNKKGSLAFGSMHVRTYESVRYGIITRTFYEDMRRSYSPLMAAQELDAQHVNVSGGRAYYSASAFNRLIRAPWGDSRPDRSRPLIIGCDFNFSPAPCIWMVGQAGPEGWVSPEGVPGPMCIHWFGEVVMAEASTPDMTKKLVGNYPDFPLYRFFGDVSGQRGTTSNAGENDYHQIAATMQDYGLIASIDVDQSNPRVRDRVENMNRLFKNDMGEVRQTYNPYQCVNFDADTRVVGWKKTTTPSGMGKLDDAGDVNRTHASDGAGYACFKLYPPQKRGRSSLSVQSAIRTSHGLGDVFMNDRRGP